MPPEMRLELQQGLPSEGHFQNIMRNTKFPPLSTLALLLARLVDVPGKGVLRGGLLLSLGVPMREAVLLWRELSLTELRMAFWLVGAAADLRSDWSNVVVTTHNLSPKTLEACAENKCISSKSSASTLLFCTLLIFLPYAPVQGTYSVSQPNNEKMVAIEARSSLPPNSLEPGNFSDIGSAVDKKKGEDIHSGQVCFGMVRKVIPAGRNGLY
jgi:hypothetical protein